MSDLIERYGYERAVRELKAMDDRAIWMISSCLKYREEVRKECLDYRREHNIFEVGDKVVFKECSGIGGASDAIDLMTVKSIDAFGVRMTNSLCPWAIQIRHATDEEIKAGKRLEVNQ